MKKSVALRNRSVSVFLILATGIMWGWSLQKGVEGAYSIQFSFIKGVMMGFPLGLYAYSYIRPSSKWIILYYILLIALLNVLIPLIISAYWLFHMTIAQITGRHLINEPIPLVTWFLWYGFYNLIWMLSVNMSIQLSIRLFTDGRSRCFCFKNIMIQLLFFLTPALFESVLWSIIHYPVWVSCKYGGPLIHCFFGFGAVLAIRTGSGVMREQGQQREQVSTFYI